MIRVIEKLGLDHGVRGIQVGQIGGMPGETEEDWKEFGQLMDDIHKNFNGRVIISLTHFHSSPHTPLQWAYAGYDEKVPAFLDEQDKLIRKWWNEEKKVWTLISPRGRETQEHDMFLQRGDRNMSKYILGVKQSWITNGKWREWGDELGFDPQEYMKEIDPGSKTPWSHVDVGVPLELSLRVLRRYNRIMRIKNERVR